MKYHIKNELRILADFSDIEADTNTILNLTNLLNEYEFLPSNYQERVSGRPNSFVLRPKFSTADGKWEIRIGKGRLIITRTLIDDEDDKEMEDVDFFSKRVQELANLILSQYQKREKGISLGFELFDELTSEEVLNSYKQIVNSMDFYNSNSPDAWKVEISTEKKIPLVADELVVIDILSLIGAADLQIATEDGQKELNGIQVKLEINSIPHSKNERYELNNNLISEFLVQSIALKNELITQIEGKIAYGKIQ